MTFPVTVQGLQASAWSRRAEAMAAIGFARELAELAESVAALEPDGRVLAAAAEDARAVAIEAVLLWKTAIREMERRAQADAPFGRAAGAR